MLTLDHLSFRYDDTPCLENITLQCPKASLWTAPNGYGKTTLLRLIAHELFPLQGAIAIDGNTTYTAAFCPSPKLLFDDLSIQTHINWLKAQFNIPQSELSRWLDVFQLSALSRMPKELSNGEKQWLLLAITCIMPADIALFDEPLQSLDDSKIERFPQIIQNKIVTGTHILVTGHTLCKQMLSNILTPVSIRP